MQKSIYIPLLVASMAIVLLIWSSKWLPIVIVFVPGVVLAFVVYLFTFYKHPPEPGKLLPLYLLALGIQFLHFAEEYVTGFTVELPKLLGQEEYSKEVLVIFNMVAYFVFALGGIALYKKSREWMIIPIFFILVGVVFNSIAHILTTVYVGGYFPGLYTAIVYLFIAPILLKRIFMSN